MAKILKFNAEAKTKLLDGISKLSDAVVATLGPCGKNVIIDEFGQIHSTKDGVTVAKSIVLKDPFEAIGANAMKEVASKSNDNCGDGTTTSTLLAAMIYKNGLKYTGLGSNPTLIKNGIKKAADRACELIKEMSKPADGKDDVRRICTVSANGDKQIGDIIADILDQVGNDGTIKVEDGSTNKLTSRIVKGMVIDQSYASPYFVTSSDTMEVDLDHPFVLVCSKKLTNFQELLPTLQSVSAKQAALLIIADDFGEDVLATLVVNRLRGLNVCAIKSPSYGDNRKAILEDIAVLCGGRVVSDETGTRLQNATTETGILGMAKRILVSRENTVIFDGMGDKAKIDERANALRKLIETTEDAYSKEEYQERLAKLTSGIGIISVGADTKAERKELRDRVDDAFCAAKAAIRSGYVPGAGVTLLNVKCQLEDELESAAATMIPDELVGMKIFIKSLDAPLAAMLENAGIPAASILVEILDNDSPTFGYNILTRKYVDLVEDGIIDPTDVVINEVKNASSVAGLLLTTECVIVEEPADKQAAPQQPMQMM